MNNIATVAYQQAAKFHDPFSSSVITQRYSEWKSWRKTTTELERLSDHQLKDIGLTRADINIVATKLARNSHY